MPIEHKTGATVLTGDSIDFFQLAALKGAVSLEVRGMKRRGTPAWRIAKEKYNLKGNKLAVFEQLCDMVDDLREKQEHVTVENGRTVREVGGQEVN